MAMGWLALGGLALAQPARPAPDWRRVGNSAVELALASPASGPVERVWFSEDGSRLFLRVASGRVLETADFEHWLPGRATPPPRAEEGAPAITGLAAEPVRGLRAPAGSARLYAYGNQLHRSDDGGLTWTDQTAHNGKSVLGAPITDLAVSARDPEEIVAANAFGVWRSLDGGASWTGLNESLPNLPAQRLSALPLGASGVRAVVQGLGVIEWAPGEKRAWRPVADSGVEEEAASRRAASRALGAEITALAAAGETRYAGAADGRLWVSLDGGRNWRPSRPADGRPVEGLFADSGNPRLALAAVASDGGPRVLRTVNAGLFWEDLSADLPPVAAHAVTADLPSGTVYVATDRGLFFTRADLLAAAPATSWSQVGGALPATRALDVKLDREGNQLFVLVEGYGVYTALAPHRLGSLRVVNAADFAQRPAAPGSLLSILGGRVRTARAGELNFPVVAASETESQIQVPFEVRDRLISLALDAGARSALVGLPVRNVSPAIFVDREGTPLVINGDNGVLLDAMNPAYSGSRLHILCTGLGRVRPEWPTGVAAPLENPPQVTAQVRAFLDSEPLEVTRAVLAPGYVGLYLVEVRLPAVVNRGPAELHIQAEELASNGVRVYLEP